MENVNKGTIDKETKKELNKQIELGCSTNQEFARTELNFLCEMFSLLQKLNENLTTLSRLYTMANSKKILEFMKPAAEVDEKSC